MTFPDKPQQKRHVYLDNAATTQMDAVVFDAMKPYLTEQYGNPSALYSLGRGSKKAIDAARKNISNIIGSQQDTIFFTSGGTESDNAAIFGVAKAAGKGHIITTKIEHHAVLHPCQELEKQGFDITYLDVDTNGQISIAELKKSLREDTILVSIMYANNEIGTILPIADIGREILKWRKANKSLYPYFHTDACQAASLELNVEKTHVDLMTMNGSKIYGPKGIGLLYKRRGVVIEPIIYGGGQEMGLRSGTEHVAGIVGFAKALENISPLSTDLRDYLWSCISKTIDDVALNGAALDGDRLANNLNVVFKGVEAEALLLYLDEYGITVGTGSACATGSDEGSHVLMAIGKKKKDIQNSIRFTLSKHTTQKDIDYVMAYLPDIVMQLRNVSSYA